MKQEQTKADRRLAHTVRDHLVEQTFMGLLVALAESLDMADEDERFATLAGELETLIETVSELVETTIDTIPGIMSREEAQALVEAEMFSLEDALGLTSETLH